MNSFQNKIFVFFLEYWPISFGVLQTCCKIQKCKKTIFWCLRNPCENTFLKLPIFLYIKNVLKHVRVLAVCNTQKKHFLYFFIENTSNAIKHKRKIAIKAKSRHIYSKIYNKLKAIIKKSNPTHPTQTAKTKIKLGAMTKKNKTMAG